MQNIKKAMLFLMAVLVLCLCTPHTSEAAPKKSVTVSVKNAKKVKGKYQLTVKKSGQLVVKYAGKNVTKKAKYKVSNKKVAAVSKGKVKAKKAGSVTVTVTYKGKTKKMKFVVVKPTAKKKSGGSTTAKHRHVWKSRIVKNKVWKSNMVEVPVYEKGTPKSIDICHGCNERRELYYDENGETVCFFPETGEKIVGRDKVEHYLEMHSFNHALKNENGGSWGWDDDGWVLVGYKTEDQGSWKTVTKKVYYCSCGAEKCAWVK